MLAGTEPFSAMGYRTKTITVIRPKNNSAPQATGLASVPTSGGAWPQGVRFIFASPKWIERCLYTHRPMTAITPDETSGCE